MTATVEFDKDTATIVLADETRISVEYGELHQIAMAYMEYYATESVQNYLKGHNRNDLLVHTEEIGAVARTVMESAVSYINDNSAIAETIVDVGVPFLKDAKQAVNHGGNQNAKRGDAYDN